MALPTSNNYLALLDRARQTGKSERTMQRHRNEYWLTLLAERGLLKHWNRQNGRWHVEPAEGSGRSPRSYTSSEVDAFIMGMDATYELLS